VRRAAVLIAMLFILPLLAHTPAYSVDSRAQSTSGRSLEADVAVTGINITTPSVMVGGTPTLAPQTHIIRVNILNLGGSSADGNLTLEANTGSGYAEVDVRTVSINSGQQEVHLLYWDATTVGTGFGLKAVWDVNLSTSTDSDSGNDEMAITGISVMAVEDAAPIADSLPDNGDTLARAQWVGGITVVNTGNQPVNVTAQLTLTSTSTAAQTQVISTTATAPSGSLANPPDPQNISLSFDGTSLEGTYTLAGSLLITGPSGTPSTVTIESRTVSFIALRATLIAASNRNIDPGGVTTLNFILQNSGDEGDNFTVTQSNTSSPGEYWANISAGIHTEDDPLFVDSGETVAIQVPVEIPSTAAMSESVRITITVQSLAAGYVLDASSIVMAGGLYQSEITQNHSHDLGAEYANITPGDPLTLDYTLKNTGTAPAQFQIFVASTQSVPYWTIHSPVTLTDVMIANETRTIPVTITTPTLQMPLNPAWNIEAGLQIQIGIQAIPVEGGLPSSNLTMIIVDGMVEMDLEILGQPRDVSVDELLSGSSDRYVDFQVQMVHNLGSNNSQAQVTLAPTVASGDTTGITFTPDVSGKENERFYASITPSTMDLSPGEIGYGVVSITHQHKSSQSHPYPAAGRFTFDFTTTSDWGDFNGTLSQDDSAEITYRVEKFRAAELASGGIFTGDPGTAIPATMSLKNTGNDADNFSIGFLPIEGWDIQVSKPAVNALKSRTNLYPFVEGHDDSDVTSFTITATPPSTASADETHEIWVYANSTDTGELLSYAPAYFQLTELVSAELSPANATAVLDRLGQTTIMILLNNSGNSNKTFDLTLDNHNPLNIRLSFADDGTVVLSKTQTVAPASQAIVRVYALAGTTARADDVNKFEVVVSSNGTELDRSGINVQVNPFHFIIFKMNEEYNAIPGGTIQVPILLENSGNLLEVVNVSALAPVGWNQSANDSAIAIEPGAEGAWVKLSITLPPLEAGESLAADKVFEIPIQVLNISDNIVIGSSNITVTILPVFALNVLAQPDRIAVLPNSDRSVQYEIQNVGNAPMTISFQWELDEDEPGRFDISLTAPNNIVNLNIGDTVALRVDVSPLKDDHYQNEDAALSIIFSPMGVELDPIVLTTPIQVVRVQTDDVYELDADGPFTCGASCVEIAIPWQYVPTGIPNPSSVAFNLSLAEVPERRGEEGPINYGQYPDTIWAFDIDGHCLMVSSEQPPGIAQQEGSSCDSGFDLDTVTPYGTGTIVLQVIIPDKKKLAPKDGWDISLLLKNPVEDDQCDCDDFWTEFTVKLRMSESSDPLIESISFNGTSVEGSQTSVNVVIINAGNAIMPTDTLVTLLCQGDYARVTSAPSMSIPALSAGGNFSATWSVTTEPLPWWSTSEPFDCEASLSGSISTVGGNNASNDNSEVALEISSWGPPDLDVNLSGVIIGLPITIILGLLLLFFAFSFLRKGMDEQPSHLHMSAYIAAASFGTISLSNMASWSIAAGAGASIAFSGVVAWISSAELQTIHDDRKKARIGARSVLEDHDKEQANTRKELRAIVSCAPYAFLPFVLISPALATDTDPISLVALVLFLIASPILVHLILRFLDKSYDRLYGELAEIELRAIKIKRILGSVGARSGAGASEREYRTGGD